MSAEELYRVVPRIGPGCRLRLVFLPGWGEKNYLPLEVIEALGILFNMKMRNQGVEISHFDLVTLNAIRMAGFYGPDANRFVEVTIVDGFDESQLELLSAGLEDLQVLG